MYIVGLYQQKQGQPDGQDCDLMEGLPREVNLNPLENEKHKNIVYNFQTINRRRLEKLLNHRELGGSALPVLEQFQRSQ